MKTPEPSKEKFMLFMIWVGLVGAVIILFIDYQIKNAILEAGDKAWKEIHALKGIAREDSSGTRPAGTKRRGVRPAADTNRDMGTVAAQAPQKGTVSRASANGKANRGARNASGQFQAADKQVGA